MKVTLSLRIPSFVIQSQNNTLEGRPVPIRSWPIARGGRFGREPANVHSAGFGAGRASYPDAAFGTSRGPARDSIKPIFFASCGAAGPLPAMRARPRAETQTYVGSIADGRSGRSAARDGPPEAKTCGPIHSKPIGYSSPERVKAWRSSSLKATKPMRHDTRRFTTEHSNSCDLLDFRNSDP